MKTIRHIITMMLMCVAGLAYAQNMVDISGVVRDTSGEPMGAMPQVSQPK